MSVSAGDIYDDSVAWLKQHYPLIAGSLPDGQEDDGSRRDFATRVLEIYLRSVGHDQSKLENALEAFATISHDFIRLQARFVKSGSYRSAAAAPIIDTLYLNEEKMRGYYLDGLLLTYAFWPNHTTMLQYFVEEFVDKFPDGVRVLEIGFGHGLSACLILSLKPSAVYTGYDISPSSVEYAHNVLVSNRVDPERFCLFVDDVTKSASAPIKYDAALCCEILEHVEHPERLMRFLHTRLRADAAAYLTTVANIDAEDHIYLFEDAVRIRDFVRSNHFDIVSDRPLPLPGMEDLTPLPLNYAVIATPVEK